MISTFSVAIVASAAATAGGMPLVIRLLRHIGSLDVPNHRSSHSVSVPRGGGLGIALGLGLGVAILLAGRMEIPWVVLAVAAAHLALGFVDDLVGLRAHTRLIALFVMSGVAVSLHSSLLNVERGDGIAVWQAGLLVVGLVAVVNAFNFMDGINGISGLTAAVASGWYIYLGVSMDSSLLVALSAPVLGASLGFLPWNFPNAKVFLGDAGSYMLGILIGSMAWISWESGVSVAEAVAPLAIYLADTGGTLLVRLIRREPLMQAHREHVYQRVADLAGSHSAASLVVTAFTLSCLLALSTLLNVGLASGVVILIAMAYFLLPRVWEEAR